MIDMKNFKGIADDIMKDVTVTEALKEKTLARCNRKIHFNYSRYLVPAACLLLMVSVVRFTGLFGNPEPQRTAVRGNDANMMMATESAMEGVKGLFDDSYEEIISRFGQDYKEATYIPEGFSAGVTVIEGEGANISVFTPYAKGNTHFTIRQAKSEQQIKPENAKEISINGIKGYIISSKAEGSVDESTELYWYSNGVQYCISGMISEPEAVKIAESMK